MKDNRILVIDDEEFCLTTMKQILYKLGIDVDGRVDFKITSQEALDQLHCAAKENISYQIIFTDFNMPVLNGIEMTKRIRKLKDIKQPIIIGITGHVQETYKSEGLKAGMDEIYSKPLYLSTMK